MFTPPPRLYIVVWWCRMHLKISWESKGNRFLMVSLVILIKISTFCTKMVRLDLLYTRRKYIEMNFLSSVFWVFTSSVFKSFDVLVILIFENFKNVLQDHIYLAFIESVAHDTQNSKRTILWYIFTLFFQHFLRVP